MEILIPGLILVALMIYASTRIKKSAAQAYESETIETDDFVIFTPAGFLTVIGGDPRFAFEAYSKEFGSESASDIRRATAHVMVQEPQDSPDAPESTGEILSDRTEEIGGHSYRIAEAKSTLKGVELKTLRKSRERNGRLVILEIVLLNETTDEFVRDIESMLQSFEVK